MPFRDRFAYDCTRHHPVLPKPQIPAPTPNRPFLWGFSLVSCRSFRLWRHLRSLSPILASRLCIQKFRSPRQGFSTARSRSAAGNFWGLGGQTRRSNPVRNYCGFNPRASNCWLHSAGASRSRSTPIPAWQTTFDRGADEIWCEERERDRHVDLTHAALLTCCDLLDVSDRARNDFVKPATTSGDGANEARATFDPRWADFTFADAVWDKNLPGSPRWRLLPRD